LQTQTSFVHKPLHYAAYTSGADVTVADEHLIGISLNNLRIILVVRVEQTVGCVSACMSGQQKLLN